jgi:hypothetical protein
MMQKRYGWRWLLGRLPLPMLALAASHGVYSFGTLYMPWYFALISALAFELTYCGLAVAELHSTDERKRARNISVGAVVVSILYNAVAAYFHRNPTALVDMPWYAEVALAFLHAAPLATVAYLVASLLLHSEALPDTTEDHSANIRIAVTELHPDDFTALQSHNGTVAGLPPVASEERKASSKARRGNGKATLPTTDVEAIWQLLRTRDIAEFQNKTDIQTIAGWASADSARKAVDNLLAAGYVEWDASTARYYVMEPVEATDGHG